MTATQPQPAPGWIENRSTAGRTVLPDLREMVRYRELALVLAVRDLQIRYKQTFLGVAWAVIQPLAATGAFSLVFGRLADLDSGGIPYPVFALAGLVGWTFLAQGTTRASTALVDNEDMVTKVYFPRMLVCIAAVLPGIADLGIALALLAVLMAVTGVAPGIGLLALPLLLVALLVLTCGAGCLAAALNVKYRDIRNALPFLLQIGLFVSPVAYSSALAHGRLDALYYLNPMAGLTDALRWSLIDGPAPGANALISLASGLVLVAAGVYVFSRTERRFADVI